MDSKNNAAPSPTSGEGKCERCGLEKFDRCLNGGREVNSSSTLNKCHGCPATPKVEGWTEQDWKDEMQLLGDMLTVPRQKMKAIIEHVEIEMRHRLSRRDEEWKNKASRLCDSCKEILL